MREIRCFISSPGDVGQERVALRVVERLANEFSERLELHYDRRNGDDHA